MKVLIISHNPVSTQSNMGKTFLSLFSGFEQQELCQLYIYPAFPDRDHCASYYRVTDKDVLRSFLRWKAPGAEVDRRRISQDQGLFEDAQDQSFYKSRKNKSALRRLLRDAMWSMSRWNSRELKKWLDAQQPDCIFVAPGVAKFLYNFALRISKERDLPVVTYICDDYYFVRKPDTALDTLRLALLKGKIRQLLDRSTHLVTISEEMHDAYAAGFSLPVTTLMTGAQGTVLPAPRTENDPESICFFGNIRCNRYVSLAQVGRELDRINAETGKNICLKIYTAEKDPEILKTFDEIRCVRLCGFLTGEAYQEAVRQADMLLHVEAFDAESIDFAKGSISTKISESLASGIPLFAYAPECVASMRYLRRSESAITAVTEEQLGRTLREALVRADLRTAAVDNALATAAVFHDSGKNSMTLRRIMQDAAAGKRTGK